MPRVLVFDVNETLLDLRALDPHFERVFGDASVRGDWFKQILQSAFLTVALNRYADFGTVGAAALEMVASRLGVVLKDDDRSAILGGMRALPAHQDVVASLDLLRDEGFRLAALTNSPQAVVDEQLTNAGLYDYFERVMSVDAVRHLKPAPETYHMAARKLGVGPGRIRLVAAHGWDVTGAIYAGCAAAFVARPGMVLDSLFEEPDVIGPDMTVVANRIIEAELGRRE